MFIKFAAFGCSGYFQNRWNCLDFLLVVIWWLPELVTSANGSNGGNEDLLKVTRVLRVTISFSHVACKPCHAVTFWNCSGDEGAAAFTICHTLPTFADRCESDLPCCVSV